MFTKTLLQAVSLFSKHNLVCFGILLSCAYCSFTVSINNFGDDLSDITVYTKSLAAGDQVNWHRPMTLSALLALKAEKPAARFVGGNTELGIEMQIKGLPFPDLIDPSYVPELRSIVASDSGLEV